MELFDEQGNPKPFDAGLDDFKKDGVPLDVIELLQEGLVHPMSLDNLPEWNMRAFMLIFAVVKSYQQDKLDSTFTREDMFVVFNTLAALMPVELVPHVANAAAQMVESINDIVQLEKEFGIE